MTDIKTIREELTAAKIITGDAYLSEVVSKSDIDRAYSHICVALKALDQFQHKAFIALDALDKLMIYAEDSTACQYGTLAADLVFNLSKEAFDALDQRYIDAAIIDEFSEVKTELERTE